MLFNSIHFILLLLFIYKRHQRVTVNKFPGART